MGVTAMVNQKGGVGKTTVALGLASALCAAGRSVLVVDLDPQANATTGLGLWDPPLTVDSLLAQDRSGSASDAVLTARWDADGIAAVPAVLASSPRLAQVEHQLVSDVIGAQDRLDGVLGDLPDDYDEVIIDCPPSLGLLTVNALFAADRVVVVTEPAAWSADGVEQILRNVERIAQRRGGRPELAGIVLNRVGRTRDAGYWASEMTQRYPEHVVEPHVKLRAAVAEAAAQAVPVHALRRSGAGEAAAELDALAEVLFGPGDPGVSLGTAESPEQGADDPEQVDRRHPEDRTGHGSESVVDLGGSPRVDASPQVPTDSGSPSDWDDPGSDARGASTVDPEDVLAIPVPQRFG